MIGLSMAVDPPPASQERPVASRRRCPYANQCRSMRRVHIEVIGGDFGEDCVPTTQEVGTGPAAATDFCPRPLEPLVVAVENVEIRWIQRCRDSKK